MHTLFLFCIALAIKLIVAGNEVGVAQLKGDTYDSTVTGYVYFVTLNETHVWVLANISGITLNPDDLHGLHVHTYGDITGPTALNTGGHYLGEETEDIHGCYPDVPRHEGDMGNWLSASGSIYQYKMLDLLALSGGFSIIGRAVVLHNLTDNCLNVSSAGSRLAQGVIGIANPTYLPTEVALVANLSSPNNAVSGATGTTKAVAVMTSISGAPVSGLVTFAQSSNGVTVQAKISGLDDNNAYGFHIHIYGDLNSTDGSAASSHYNPYSAPHGLPPNASRHVGDLGNICTFGSDGFAYYSFTFTDLLTLSGSNNVIGRDVIIHSIRDDGVSSNFGTRIAQGVIGIGSSTTNIIFPSEIIINQPACIPPSPGGDDGGMSGVAKAFLSIFIIAIVSAIVLGVYQYNKNGRIFGYSKAKRGVPQNNRASSYEHFNDDE